MLSVVYQEGRSLPVVLAVFLMRSDADTFAKKHSWTKVVDVESWDAWTDIREVLAKEVGHA